MEKPICPHCHFIMLRSKKVTKNRSLQFSGGLLQTVAIILLFLVPVGTIVGIIMLCFASNMGKKTEDAIVCQGCGFYYLTA
jgi:hypothetical protein